MELDLAAFPVPFLTHSPRSTAGKPVLPDLPPVGARKIKLMLSPSRHNIHASPLKEPVVVAECTTELCGDASYWQNITFGSFLHI